LTSPSSRIAPAQLRPLVEHARAAGHSDADVKAYLAAEWGVISTAEINHQDYDAVIARLDQTTPLAADRVTEPPSSERPILAEEQSEFPHD
jgi:hypothetical protein